jgi:hypothetical protein
MVTGSRYVLRLNVGRPASDSVVEKASENPFPDAHLPEVNDGHWLQIAVFSAELEVPEDEHAMFLPRSGESWCCDCQPGGAHRCTPGQRRPFALLPVATGVNPGVVFVRIALYYANNLVQSLLLAADLVEDSDAEGKHGAVVDYTLSEDLSDLDHFEPRVLNILTNETAGGTHRLVFKDQAQHFDFTFGEGALTQAMADARRRLLEIHVDQVGNSRLNRLQRGNSKPPKEFVTDLATIAREGYARWQSLFLQSGDALRTAGLGSSGTIQIARVPLTSFVFPWAALYDMPLDLYEADLTPCQLITDWDGRGPMLDGAPAHCPYEHMHAAKNTLCPFGLWGVRYAIEHPAGSGPVVREVGMSNPRVLLAGISRELNRTETERHIAELRTILSGIDVTVQDTRAGLASGLGAPPLEIAYFYCHGATSADGVPCLVVGDDEEIPVGQVLTWYLSDWPKGNWERTRPLVVLNGCHTADLTPLTPINFVDVFASAKAGGVIGTEITLDQVMAGEAAEFLLRGLAASQLSVGEAVRRLRLHFISKGNLLGLAYTAYCSADLRLAS